MKTRSSHPNFDLRLIFFHIPKCAGTSIDCAIREPFFKSLKYSNCFMEKSKIKSREFVIKSAQLMAAIRAKEHEKKERLFTDPYAAKLAGKEGLKMLEEQLPSQDHSYILVRTRFFDDFIMETVKECSQIVLLASAQLTAKGSYLGLDVVDTKAIKKQERLFQGHLRSGFDNPQDMLGMYGWDAKVFRPAEVNEFDYFHRYNQVFSAEEQQSYLIKAKKK